MPHPLFDSIRYDAKRLAAGHPEELRNVAEQLAEKGRQFETEYPGMLDILRDEQSNVFGDNRHGPRISAAESHNMMLAAFRQAEEKAYHLKTAARRTREREIASALGLGNPHRAEQLADIQRRREMAAQSGNPRDRAAIMAALDAEEAALPRGGRKKKTRKTRKSRKVTRRRR
jgi:hypothetical protein